MLLEKGERILKFASVCQRMETEREKLLPFVIGRHTSNALSEVEENGLEMACKGLPTEPLAKVKYYFI